MITNPLAPASTDADDSRLTFPDLPRMELDELLGRLVERGIRWSAPPR
ncbi:hypothetical protein ACWEGE_05240 [Amycolatopsis sp. NPDC004747]